MSCVLAPLAAMALSVSGQTVNGHAYVALGLSVKWATCNVGASSPEDYGDYYAWGETSTKSSYDEDNSETYGKDIDDISGTDRDVAHVKWGGTWRMPTDDEIEELLNECMWTWTTRNGVNGYMVTSPKNGYSIFLPATGWRSGIALYHAGGYGGYWCSTPYEDSACDALILLFNNGYHLTDRDYRHDGFPVRPVSE